MSRGCLLIDASGASRGSRVQSDAGVVVGICRTVGEGDSKMASVAGFEQGLRELVGFPSLR
jgi:hypothetical protein